MALDANVRTRKSPLVGLVLATGLLALVADAVASDFYSAIAQLPPDVHVYRYSGQPQSFLGLITPLPQLYVFNAQGHQIYGHTGDDDHLAKALDKVFSSGAPAGDGKALDAWTRKLTPLVGTQTVPTKSSAQFTIIEYWASWCRYCFVERDQLLAYFREHPNLRVNWILADADKHKTTH